MRFTLRSILAATLMACASIIPAAATAQTIYPGVRYAPNEVFEGLSALSNTSYTNATTTATTLTGTDIIVPATSFDPAKRLLTACISADVTKSTGGTGQIGVAVDGVLQASSLRYSSSAAGRNTIAGCFSWVRTTANAFTVTLQGVSSDTNSFAVQNAQMILVQRSFN